MSDARLSCVRGSPLEGQMDETFGSYIHHLPSVLRFMILTRIHRNRFDDNACVLLNNKGEMIGTRVNGVVAAELRDIQGGPAGSGGRWGKVLGLAGKVRRRVSLEGFSNSCWIQVV
jgi:hypothetical protein